ncbi:MAG: hypothetical protein COZ49_03030 [Candidatus Yonathbacteria bacterium CG_4_10_14_3_um_filter_47_65]|uniref:Type II secretion system protein GspF domain-containing protein n=2 Tax=Parcubacteria group TaxID=1794811 RepID=A0A2M8D5X6_9BACT|nr:MAG: hypothetical protein AUJ44_02755 [Candidatus Nomurabacteria bacterium CG1_02_47_685]PIP04011.1 MAG: hypothetical protein COX54_01410 [Candidatus Yonathbacteria bacterium CG23_combo_of_CG06-09_8_20_14_all_46_18]PIQ31227.1 MAG: hypothetical protein COW61_04150 [Candidatus Yonathbacteria bacterium CG17_big_fil_post_rev_8_21_14_2_50_46_19]PIX56253.1 MAG: hypothetical protein COZ49_03030 [Candidatus Yonathbacteria bacterium CG_4_10_14_3_um_filter_47_65]PIY57463.1 MAG: hypothetical protein CO
MIFTYKAVTKNGEERTGMIEALNQDVAISSLQRRDLIVVSVVSEESVPFFEKDIAVFSRVSMKDVVILSRQIATLFEAQVPALKAFRLLAMEMESPLLRKKLDEIADDIQGGMSISSAMKKHPTMFSDFYVNMVLAGGESGKLSETFAYLADYLDRAYELSSRIRNAMIYPAFVIGVFVIVMIGLFTFIIPKITDILVSSGGEIPFYTQIVISISSFLVHDGVFLLAGIGILGVGIWRFKRTNALIFSKMVFAVPVLGELYRKLYLARISDNMHTMLISGIPMVRAIEITSDVVGNESYKQMLVEAMEAVKAGDPLSKSLSRHKEIPTMMIQMMRVGEETGELGPILEKIAAFYKREVDTMVDILISLIEPAMIVLLGLGVGTVLAAVLLPIYNIAGNI